MGKMKYLYMRLLWGWNILIPSSLTVSCLLFFFFFNFKRQLSSDRNLLNRTQRKVRQQLLKYTLPNDLTLEDKRTWGKGGCRSLSQPYPPLPPSSQSWPPPTPPTPVPSEVGGVRQLSVIPKGWSWPPQRPVGRQVCTFKGKHGRTHAG